MEVVINIPDSMYEYYKTHIDSGELKVEEDILGRLLNNGKVLPKGHGRLIDADKEIKCARKWIEHPNQYISQRNKDFIYYLEKTEAVIEADKENEEWK